MSCSRHCAVALAFAATVAMSGFSPTRSQAEERASPDARVPAPFLLGFGAHDPRGRLDPDKISKRAVGKLQIASVSFHQSCTATLVDPSTVLTAAHCAFNLHTQRYHLPGSLHFLIGCDGSRYAGHAIGIKIETGPGYDPPPERDDRQRLGIDIARYTARLVGSGFADDRRIARDWQHNHVGGYQQDHPLVLMADAGCRIVGRVIDSVGDLLLRHNCTGTRGVSGAPLLIEKEGKWYTAGIDVAAELGVASGFAVVLNEPRKHL